jgi:hypothetical protein
MLQLAATLVSKATDFKAAFTMVLMGVVLTLGLLANFLGYDDYG